MAPVPRLSAPERARAWLITGPARPPLRRRRRLGGAARALRARACARNRPLGLSDPAPARARARERRSADRRQMERPVRGRARRVARAHLHRRRARRCHRRGARVVDRRLGRVVGALGDVALERDVVGAGPGLASRSPRRARSSARRRPLTIAKRFCACASVTIADASLPSTLSALKPVATPVAFVVSGAALGFGRLDAADLGRVLAARGELEGEAVREVVGAHAGLVALRGAAGARAAAVDRAAAVVGLVRLARAVGGARLAMISVSFVNACRWSALGLRAPPSSGLPSLALWASASGVTSSASSQRAGDASHERVCAGAHVRAGAWEFLSVGIRPPPPRGACGEPGYLPAATRTAARVASGVPAAGAQQRGGAAKRRQRSRRMTGQRPGTPLSSCVP